VRHALLPPGAGSSAPCGAELFKNILKYFEPAPPFDPPPGVKAEKLKPEMLKLVTQSTLCQLP
jgi:hypothetical protein